MKAVIVHNLVNLFNITVQRAAEIVHSLYNLYEFLCRQYRFSCFYLMIEYLPTLCKLHICMCICIYMGVYVFI